MTDPAQKYPPSGESRLPPRANSSEEQLSPLKRVLLSYLLGAAKLPVDTAKEKAA